MRDLFIKKFEGRAGDLASFRANENIYSEEEKVDLGALNDDESKQTLRDAVKGRKGFELML